MATGIATAPKISPGPPPGPKRRFLLGSLVEVSRDWLGARWRASWEMACSPAKEISGSASAASFNRLSTAKTLLLTPR